MEMEIDEIPNKQHEQNTNLEVKRKTHVGCWKNKTEFNEVYSWLFDDKYANNNEAKQRAIKQMKIWKLRRLNLTPAAVLSTIVLIEVQLKDDLTTNSMDTDVIDNELKILYSSSFIRFFNYMSSIMQSKSLKSMYEIAKELKIESFIVDLRHLCSHGQLMPELSVLRNALKYCIKWLKNYYWDNELNYMTNVTSDNIRLYDLTQIDNNITHLFQLYDTTLELRFKNCNIAQGRKVINVLRYNELKKYSNLIYIKDLKLITQNIITDLSKIIKREPGLKDLPQIYIEAFFKMVNIFKLVGSQNKLVTKNLINLNRDLFKSIANHGFLEELFFNLIVVCENENEEYDKRSGCGFWAQKIAEGYIAFKKLKMYYKSRKEKDTNFSIQVKSINTNAIQKEILDIYTNKLKVDYNTTLIFSDNFRRPWSLQFNLEYIQERLIKINMFTKNVIQRCISLVNPPLSKKQLQDLKRIIEIFNKSNKFNVVQDQIVDNVEYYHIKDGNIILGNCDDHFVPDTIDEDNLNEKQYGIWTMASDDQNWSAYPLGRLIWE